MHTSSPDFVGFNSVFAMPLGFLLLKIPKLLTTILLLISRWNYEQFLLCHKTKALISFLASSRLAPCTDVCMDYAHSKVRELNLIKEGSIAKQRYLELGAAHAEGEVSC